MKGIFISFEGCDGTGKTTQIQLLAHYLENKGYDVVCTREPGGTDIGNKIRSLLLDPANSICPKCEALLYMAARAEHVSSFIKPALAAGKIVLSDRFSDSTFVYQGAARRIPLEQLQLINDFAADGVVPDVTILLDAEINKLQKRIKSRGHQDRLDMEKQIFHERVRQGFLNIAKQDARRVKIIDAFQPIEKAHHDIIEIINTILAGGSHESR